MKQLPFFLFLIFIASNLKAQDPTYQVIFRTIPQMGKTMVKVDNVLTEKVVVRLSPGQHFFSFWANGYQQKDTLIEVQGNINLKISLTRTLEYITYNEQVQAYKKQALRKKFLPLLVSSGMLAIGGGFYLAANKSQNEASSIIDKYNASRSYKGIIAIKKEFEEKNMIFKRRRVVTYSALGIGITSGVIALIGNKNLKKKHNLKEFPKNTPFSNMKLRINNNGLCLSKKFSYE